MQIPRETAGLRNGYDRARPLDRPMDGERFFTEDIPSRRVALFLVACTSALLLVPVILGALQVGQAAVFTVELCVGVLFTIFLGWRSRPNAAS